MRTIIVFGFLCFAHTAFAGPLCFSKTKDGCKGYPDPSKAVGNILKSNTCQLELKATTTQNNKKFARLVLSKRNGDLIASMEVQAGASLRFKPCKVRLHIDKVFTKTPTAWISVFGE